MRHVPARYPWHPAIPWPIIGAMVDGLLFCDWDDPPAAMDLERGYGDALDRVESLVEALGAVEASGRVPDETARGMAVELYVLAPAIVNVALNYRICVEFGLPLHPTVYFELDGIFGDARVDESAAAAAFALNVEAVALARAAYRLDPGFRAAAESFRRSLPPGIQDFVYTGLRDKYTWRAAEPAKVRALAASVAAVGVPSLAVGAAHGSIMAGLLLAEYLACPLWFLRFSMFKRRDREPVVSARDEAWVRGFGPDVLAFDEDSASGTTLTLLAARVRLMAPEARTGAVIRHASSTFRPDHVGRTWWD